MGAACMIGLGLALARPDKRVLVVTGDGELLMNIGALATIAVMNPANLSILCVDNGHYGETGWQKSHTSLGVDLEKMAIGAGIKRTRTVAAEEDLADGARLLREGNGTSFVVVRVRADRAGGVQAQLRRLVLPRPLPRRACSGPCSSRGGGVSLQQALFSPRSVAVVGQSDDAGKTAGRPLKFLRQMGYAGRIYPINPRRETVLGERAWPSLTALPEPPDHVYVVTPTEAAVEAVEECGRLGVKVVTVLADGFAEAGAAGAARETRLRDVCARTGLRIVGPSSLGVVDLRSKAMLTANAAFDETELPVGRIFAASHSGSMIGALLTRGKARGIGFAGLVSVGNEVDLSLGDICETTLDDPGIDGYMLFLETMRHAASLRRFALAAAERGKPVLAYKLGRSAAARELAVSHTGALAGEDDVADVFLAECGIARVDTLRRADRRPAAARARAAGGARRAAQRASAC